MYDAHKVELEILDFWKNNRIFNKLRKKNKGRKRWSFLDGPITANNQMGVHHAWGRTYKDLFQRFKAMQGYDQRYQNGFDCQGLWIEREEEKSLGLKTKIDIENYGVLNFVKSCRKRVEKFSKIITNQSIRLGMWMDWDNSYYTMPDENNLHNWFLIKEYYKKGWLYKGKDVVPWCWRCGTASSKHDIITEGYKEITHNAIFMQFPLKEKENEYFLIFTTTPWTIPADVALAVNEKVDYVKVKQDNKFYWLAKAKVDALKGDYVIIETLKGKKLEGKKYIMPYKDLENQKNVDHKVVLWELTSEEEGTGIVHVAPGCGPEDYSLGKELKLAVVAPLDEQGVYLNNFGEFSNKKYSEVNKEVLEDMKQRSFIYKIEPYRHRYPHCWRCSEELVFRLVDEWYVKCKQIRDILIKENKKIKWYPEYGKVRQEDWFNNMGDWLISRKRYWGLPLPIWECECGEVEVIGSLEELKKKAIDKKKVNKLPEIHKPWIDEIKIKCKKCKKEVNRITDVGDAWLDAGVTPLSTIGPYLTNKQEWKKWFPADFITENLPGQYRGWFNAILWSSVAITGKASFKSMFGYETLKDEKGEEMHKSKGNAIWFDDAVEKIGADTMRLLYCLQNPSLELKFGYHASKEPKNSINILYNMSRLIEKSKTLKIPKIEDKWIVSKLNSTIKKVTDELENLHPHLAASVLQDFWLNDFSRGYIQFVRSRISEKDEAVKSVMFYVYLNLIKLTSPFLPFITEKIYQDFKIKFKLKEESIHLFSWPKSNQGLINKRLEEYMGPTKEVIQEILAQREKAQIGVRWPLPDVEITTKNPLAIKQFKDLILKQTNIKKIKIEKGELKVKLNTKLTSELEKEGFARELIRKIQDLRKKTGLQKENRIELVIDSDYSLEEYRKQIQTISGATLIIFEKPKKTYKTQSKEKIKEKEFNIYFNKK